MLKDTLDDTTAVGMLGHLKDASLEGGDEEGSKGSGDTLDALLDDVIAILVSHQLKDMAIQFLHYSTLIVGGKEFEGLLDDPTSIHLATQLQDVSPHGIGQGSPLVEGSEFKDLLDDIVSKDIRHQVVEVGKEFGEDGLSGTDLIGDGMDGDEFEALLDVATAVLVGGKVIGHSDHLGQVKTGAQGVELEEVEELDTGVGLIGG